MKFPEHQKTNWYFGDDTHMIGLIENMKDSVRPTRKNSLSWRFIAYLEDANAVFEKMSSSRDERVESEEKPPLCARLRFFSSFRREMGS